MNEQVACAHSKVELKHDEHPGGFRSDYWECDSGCGRRFYPETVDQNIRNLRDWFAGMALQGMLANPQRGDQFRETATSNATIALREIALLSFQAADSMLKARNSLP